MTRAAVRVDPAFVDGWAATLHQAFVDGMASTAATAADRIGVTVTAAAALEPGERYVSLDDLVVITTAWATVVDGTLVPLIEQVYRGAGLAWALALEAVGLGWDTAAIPPVTSQTAVDYLAGAANRLRRVAYELWQEAREQLAAGFEVGESIPELAARVRDAARITSGRRATTIARTEVISASNGGSIAVARLLGDDDISKVWEATADDRTRPSHVQAHGQRVPLSARFEVGGAPLDFPGDPTGPAEETVNCRCAVTYDVPAPGSGLVGGGGDMGSVTAAAGDGVQTGAMVALIPRQADIDRLAVDGGEPPGELHLTLLYLGDAADIPVDARATLVSRLSFLVGELPVGLPVQADGFAVSVFNPGSDEPAVVLGVSGADLEPVHGRVADAVYDVAAGPPGFALPEQHSPWIPHVTLAYSDDAGLVERLTDRVGPVEFDRLRIAFAGEITDLPLTSEETTGEEESDMPDGMDTATAVVQAEGQPDGVDATATAVVEGPSEGVDTATAVVEGEGQPEGVDATATAVMPEECPPGHHPGPDGECVPDEPDEPMPADGPPVGEQRGGHHFHALMIIEGTSTGFRTFYDLGWREPPFAFRWQQQEPEMGGHALATHVGNIEEVERQAGVEIHAWGRLDLDDPNGLEFARKLAAGFAPWVSIGLDEEPPDIEIVWPEGLSPDDIEGPDGELNEEALFAEPEQMIIRGGRIAELTALTTPAMQEARVEPLPALLDALAERGVLVASAVGRHETGTSDDPWDGPANEARLPSPVPMDAARAAYAWIEGGRAEEGKVPKDACRFVHHNVSEDGTPGAANLTACSTGIGVLNGGRGGTTIPDGDVQGVYDHLAGHLRDAGQDPPPLDNTTAVAGAVTAAAYTIEIPDLPPRSWFAEPTDVDVDGALTITSEGRVYGYVGLSGLAHRGFRGRRVEVPRGNVDYTRWMGGQALVADGGRVAAGPITMECGHYPPEASSDTRVRMDHYDNACSVVAKACVGENRHGVWIAGALEPGVTAEQVSRMMACRLSGDWGPHPERPGEYEFVAALIVPVPAFAQPRMSTRVRHNGDGLALVASAVPVRYATAVPSPLNLRPTLEVVARAIGRDTVSRMTALRRRVHPT